MIKVEVGSNSDWQQTVAEAVQISYVGGASTVELCGAMHLNGLTPTIDQIKDAKTAIGRNSGLMVMIRPRGGDFHYSSEDLKLMINQINMAADLGADGVVFGVLDKSNSSIDQTALRLLIKESEKNNLKTTFHRAFDAVSYKTEVLNLLIDFGINRVLTSGTNWGSKSSAIDGIENLNKYIQAAGNQIEIVIGGGINNENAQQIITSLPTKIKNVSLHSYSGMQTNKIVDLQKVKTLVSIANNLSRD